jgi:hypothetical protein
VSELSRNQLISLFLVLLSIFFVAGCAADEPTPIVTAVSHITNTPTHTPQPSATLTTTPTETAVPTATFTAVPQPTETAMPTPLPTNAPIPEPVWSILFTGRSCSKSATDCTEGQDMSPSMEYMIYSDGTGLRPFSDIEGIPHDLITVEFIVLSPDQSRVAFYSGDKFMLGDVGGDIYSEVAADISHFYPFSFYGNDLNCLAGFDDALENGEVVVTLYKGCIGDTEPTLVETTVLPTSREGSHYLLSPEGDKWAAYTIGNSTLDEQAVLHVHKIGDSNPPQPIFQQQSPSCTSSMHWQDNETLEFLYAECDNTHDRMTYFYVTDWEGKVLTTRYELPALKVPHPVRASFYTAETGDWFADNNLFIFSVSRNGSPSPEFNGLYVLNLTTGEVQQILSNTVVFAIRAWLPLSTNEE